MKLYEEPYIELINFETPNVMLDVGTLSDDDEFGELM